MLSTFPPKKVPDCPISASYFVNNPVYGKFRAFPVPISRLFADRMVCMLGYPRERWSWQKSWRLLRSKDLALQLRICFPLNTMGMKCFLDSSWNGQRLAQIHRQEADFVKRWLDWRQSGFLLSLSLNPSYISYFPSWRAFRASKRPKLNDPYPAKAFAHCSRLSSLSLTCGNLLLRCICPLMVPEYFLLNGKS